VIDVALLGIIRRWHLRDQVPLREIAKRLGISRNTVRRYLRSETTEPAYAERQSASAIDPYAFQLSGWLKTEAAKSRKQRRSLKQLHEDLSELGFKGSYDRVAAFARQWREGQTEWVNSARKRTVLVIDEPEVAEQRMATPIASVSKAIKIVCPSLHHHLSLSQVLRSVVSAREFVGRSMRQLPINDLMSIAQALLDGGHRQRTESMPGHFPLVAHALQRLQNCVVAEWFLMVSLVREQVPDVTGP
jgi:transcriptional regulator with XRE-family HTH domain